MSKLRILYVASEINPFLQYSEVGKMLRKLPQAMQERGLEVRILIPRFGLINERKNRLHEVVRLSGINISVGEEEKPLIIKVASIPNAKLQVYFIDNEDYFQRKYVFRDKENKFYADNDERTIFFCKGALETVKKLGWAPDIVHCHGWMTSLVPAYIKTTYKNDPTFKNAKVVYSVYENCFTEKLNADLHKKAMMQHMTAEDTKSFVGADNNSLHIGAITHADAVVLADEKLDEEVLKFVKDSNKPTLAFNLTENYENFFTFYEEISNEELVSVA